MTSEPTTAGPARSGVDRMRTCPRCGATFGCGADRGPGGSCWCGGVVLTPTATARLAGTYDGCLCPPCLRDEGADPAGGAGSGRADDR